MKVRSKKKIEAASRTGRSTAGIVTRPVAQAESRSGASLREVSVANGTDGRLCSSDFTFSGAGAGFAE
jgi:hypothetical protein